MIAKEVAERPAPPPTIYKYVGPERVDVLANASIRFTPPLNSNDIFEVRQTFEMLAGPKMRALFEEVSQTVDFDETLTSALKDTRLAGGSPDAVKAFVQQFAGVDLETTVRSLTDALLRNRLFPMMNTAENIDGLLQQTAGKLLCLSLSERADSSPMWAHYAANSSGFVIAFDTSNRFFRRGDGGERQGLQKITYFDGRIAELMDNPYAALISKQADWAYEREWRLYLKTEMADQIVTAGAEDIHIVRFPHDAVQRVILGVRTSKAVEAEVRDILMDKYPGVSLVRMRSDRSTATLSEVPAPA